MLNVSVMISEACLFFFFFNASFSHSLLLLLTYKQGNPIICFLSQDTFESEKATIIMPGKQK